MIVRHIWFDVDGTLYKTPETLEEKIFEKMFDVVTLETGRDLDLIRAEYTLAYFKGFENINEGKPLRSHTRVFSKVYGLEADLARRTYGLVDVPSALEEDERLRDMFSKISLIPLSLYSNNYHSWIVKILKALGIENVFFRHELNGESAFPKDGSTKGFERILTLSRAQKEPHTVLFVGDREEVDIEPAHRVGMTTARVCWDERSEHYSLIADRKYELKDIYSLKELVSHLMNLE
ncbi:HAD family hydrolase [Candidatus Woesearchaeota archaeon]|nr:MAG: HAD family hydrolase [Candidatus Woesearchaeota archaeon]